MKYAIVEDGGKQYKAVEGGTIDVDFYPAEIGEPVDLEHVLLIAEDGNVNVGKPYVTGAQVQAKVCGTGQGSEAGGLPIQAQKAHPPQDRSSPEVHPLADRIDCDQWIGDRMDRSIEGSKER